MPDKQRAEMCRQALETAGRADEQKLILGVLERYSNADTLKVAIHAASLPGLKEDASHTALVVAHKMGGDSGEARELLAKIGLEPLTVEILKAEYGAGATQKDVTAELNKQSRGLAQITLPSAYNVVFGGDPLPGTAKQLKVQYRINGKAGEASFPENAVITLPSPK